MSAPSRADEVAAAIEEAAALRLPGPTPEHLVVLAPGRAAPIAEALGGIEVKVPVVRAELALPPYVGASSLVLALSSTAGQLNVDLVERARSAGAHVIAIGPATPDSTSSDEIVELVDSAHGIAPMSLFGATLVVLHTAGVLSDPREGLNAALAQLERRAGSSEARLLATEIGRTFPVVWGVAGLGSAAAVVWRNEVALRTKAPALYGRLPDATFVEVAGFGLSGDVTRQLFSLVRLELDGEQDALRRRTGVALEVIRETLVAIHDVSAQGAGPLAQVADLFLLGEQLARALADQEGVDADAVAILGDIDRIGAALSKIPRGS